jgi:hypothetical protein
MIVARIDGDRAMEFDGFDQHQQTMGCSAFLDSSDDLVKVIEPF